MTVRRTSQGKIVTDSLQLLLTNHGNINELEDGEKEIIDLVMKNPQITLDMMAEMTGKSKRTVSRLIKGLKEKKILKRIGSNKSGKWIVDR